MKILVDKLQKIKLNIALLRSYKPDLFSLSEIPPALPASIYASKTEKKSNAYKRIMKKLTSYLGSGPIGPNKFWEYPWIVKNLQVKKNLTILDAGCGRSPLQYMLADLDMRISGVDPAENVGWHGIDRRLAKKFGVQIDYRVEDISKLSYGDETFDRVMCVSVIEHCLANQTDKKFTGFTPADFALHASMMKEMARVLKKGGLLIVTVDIFFPGEKDFLQYNIDIPNLIESSGLTFLGNSELPNAYDKNHFSQAELMEITDLDVIPYKGMLGTSLGLIFRK